MTIFCKNFDYSINVVSLFIFFVAFFSLVQSEKIKSTYKNFYVIERHRREIFHYIFFAKTFIPFSNMILLFLFQSRKRQSAETNDKYKFIKINN